MKLIWIIGSGAVGKMTVGQELMKITDLRLFHNHMMIEAAIDIFGRFEGKAILKLREVIFEEFSKSDLYGMIFTYMWAFDMESDREYVEHVTNIFKEKGAEIYCVELISDQETRLKRNETENRRSHKKSKQNIEFSKGLILNEDKNYRLVSNDGEIPFENYMRIDNTNLSPDSVANMIKKEFKL